MKKISECTILLVDDMEINIDIMLEFIGNDYEIIVAMDGKTALKIIEKNVPDLILLDIQMPGMDGYEVCRRIKADEKTKNIPIIFVSALDEVANEAKGLKLGAIDYITKPISPPIVKERIKNHLYLQLAKEKLENQNIILEEKVKNRTQEIILAQDLTIHALASLSEIRDPETGAHIMRTQKYVKALAQHLKHHSRYKDILDDRTIELLYKTAPLHDIGKVGVPDSILFKNDKLTVKEYEEIKKHTIYGRDALQNAKKMLGDNSFVQVAQDIVYAHHERWDGSGYPQGIKGEEIPFAGRFMAITDTYDALITRRVYKPPYSHQKALKIIIKEKGKKFDPFLVEAFCEIEKTIEKIANQYV